MASDEGQTHAEMVIDREGKVRDVALLVSDSPGMIAAARDAFATMHFKPFLVNGTRFKLWFR